MSRTCATILPSSSTTASFRVVTSTCASTTPAGILNVRVTVACRGSVFAKSPTWFSATTTSTGLPGGAPCERRTVNVAVCPSVMGERSAVIVTTRGIIVLMVCRDGAG